MQTFPVHLKEIAARNLGAAILVALAIVEIVSLILIINAQPDNTGVSLARPVLKISEIRGPRIDDQAAMIVAEGVEKVCSSLPVSIWTFLLLAYAALLVFNFSYTFKETEKPQWFWEVLLTLLFIAGWFVWDGCRVNVWFPLAIAKFGLIIFALYIYLLKKKQMIVVQAV